MPDRWPLGVGLCCAIVAGGCAASRSPAEAAADPDSSGPAGAAPGHFRSAAGEGDVQVTWSIASADLPPSIEGAGEVVTSAAMNDFFAHVGRFIAGNPAVYEGELEVRGDGLVPLPRTRVSATLEHTRNVYRPDRAAWALLHQLRVYSAEHQQRVELRQEGVLDAAPPAAWVLEDGRGAAEVTLGVVANGAGETGPRGDCYGCMTLLGDPGDDVQTIVISASELDTAEDPSRAVAIEGRLEWIAPQDLSPPQMSEAGRVSPRYYAATPSALDDFREVEPGRWERVHTSTTRVRCVSSGSRTIELRTTWHVQQGDAALSGIGDIEVTDALPCEPIQIGGGS